MAATDLHGYNDEFGDDAEFGREGGIYVGVTETQANCTVCADDFEEDVEHGEGWVPALDTMAFGDGDDKKS